jgi:hypothetical protein
MNLYELEGSKALAEQARRSAIEQALLFQVKTLQRAFAVGDNELAMILESLTDWFSLSEDAAHFEPTKSADWCLAQVEE